MKATFKAAARLLRAAWVVRLFAFVATFIPRKPANPEANAPTINDKEINALESVLTAFAIPSRALPQLQIFLIFDIQLSKMPSHLQQYSYRLIPFALFLGPVY